MKGKLFSLKCIQNNKNREPIVVDLPIERERENDYCMLPITKTNKERKIIPTFPRIIN